MDTSPETTNRSEKLKEIITSDLSLNKLDAAVTTGPDIVVIK